MPDLARLEQLRLRTREALARHAETTVVERDPGAQWGVSRLLEELQLYQAELEAQNEELRQAQQNVSRALAQYTLLFQSLPLPALVVEFNGMILQANQQANGLFQFSGKASLAQHSLYRILTSESASFVHTALRNRNGGGVQKLPGLKLAPALKRAQQDAFLIHLSSEFHLDDHILLLFVDRSADLERERQNQKTQSLLELRRTASALDEGALLAAAGRSLERLTGSLVWRIHRLRGLAGVPRKLAQSLGRSVVDDWVEELVAGPGMRAAETSLRIHRFQEPAHPPAATRREWHAISVAVQSQAGEPEHLLLTAVRQEGAYQADEQAAAMALAQETAHLLDQIQNERQVGRLSQALTQSVEGIFITDLRGIIQYINPGFARLTGYSAAEAVGKPIRLLKSGRHDTDFYLQMWRTLRASGAWQGEVMNRCKDAQVAPHWLSLSTIRSAGGEAQEYIGALVDLSQRKADEERIHQLAYFDALTGLPNRRLLTERIKLALASRHRSGENGAILFIDLDDFKRINDTLGHDQGDELLKFAAAAIKSCVREVDMVARLGGDEFVVLLDFPDKDLGEAACSAERVAHKLMGAISRPVTLMGRVLNVTPSIGIAVLDDASPTVEDLLKHADLAMYKAKAEGRNTYRFFDPTMQAEADARSSLEVDLLLAIEYEQFELYFQPQCDLDGRILGFEALLRWRHPTLGLLLPERFIGLAEQTGLIVRIGQWVLETAARQLARWADSPTTRDLTIAINVSARQLRDQNFIDAVVSALRTTGCRASCLELELTESVLLHNIDDASRKMRSLRDLGVALSLDDFGTGYSSLAYLQQLPLRKLKIDQRFVHAIPHEAASGDITRTIIGLARSLGLQVLAEGVETRAQYEFLVRNGCDYFQGYYFSRPVSMQYLPD